MNQTEHQVNEGVKKQGFAILHRSFGTLILSRSRSLQPGIFNIILVESHSLTTQTCFRTPKERKITLGSNSTVTVELLYRNTACYKTKIKTQKLSKSGSHTKPKLAAILKDLDGGSCFNENRQISMYVYAHACVGAGEAISKTELF